MAIVGMGCRFPGAGDLATFWENILAARDATRDVPPDRWDADVFGAGDDDANDRVTCRRGGYLDDVPLDPAAAGVLPLAVDGAEPEQFLVLDAARAALADAGLPDGPEDGRRVEVVIGRGNYFNRGNLARLQHGRIVAQTLAILRALHPDWTEAELEAVRADLKSGLPPFGPETIPGQLTNATAGRLANRLDLRGASFVVDAASASSLVALDLAARSLASGRADLVLVGGVYVQSDVDFPLVFSRLDALSRSGRARPFSTRADGLVPGEGVGVVVLKRRADAERDGDRLYAVLKAVGISSDGRGQGLATPSARGHARAIRRAYRRAGVEPSSVGLIEGHGLGVPASDRAELRALRSVFPPSRRRALGAVSALIGHAMPAAGMAGLIKTCLALHHRVLPPSPDAGEPHPLLAGEKSPCVLNHAARPWIKGDPGPRRAGVNAFGFAGINAHAILEEHRASADGVTHGAMPRWDTEAVLLGAPDRATWVELARALAGWLGRGPDVALKDLAAALNAGQPPFAFRVGLVVASLDELRDRLTALATRLADPTCRQVRDARGTYFWDQPSIEPGELAFVFSGEGSQYPGMLADLCPHFPEVRRLFDTADRVAIERGHAHRPSDLLFGGAGDAALWGFGPAIIAVLSAQWALYQLLTRLGVRPGAVAGHSSGELLALAAAGSMDVDRSFEDRLGAMVATLEALEGSGEMPAAALVAIATGRERVEAACREAGASAVVAMDNCPHQVVLAGDPGQVEAVAARLRPEGVLCESLPFARAYHTAGFEPALGPLREFFAALPLRSPRLPFYSCATAGRFAGDVAALRALSIDQWARPVLFRRTVEAMHDDGVRLFVEVGARGLLTGFIEDTLRGRPAVAVAANLPRRSGTTQLNHLVATLYARGVPLRADYLYARRRPAPIDFAADPPRGRPLPTLSLGFPEMRLSAGLAERLREQSTIAPHKEPGRNGSTHAGPIAHPPHVGEGANGHAPHVGTGSPETDEAMLAFFRSMDDFLSTQREVMAAYLGGAADSVLEPAVVTAPVVRPPAHRSNGNGHHEEVITASAPAAPPESPPVERALLEVVAARTGYPTEMLALDLDLEADLGIDSIKRAEILGELQVRIGGNGPFDADRLARCKTLRQVRDLLASAAPAPVEPRPWLGEVRQLEPGRGLVAVRRLEIAGDPVAENHTLGGRRVSALDPGRKGLPVVPFTVMAEMLAQAATALVPGRALLELRDVQAHRWIRYEEEPLSLEIRARAEAGSETKVFVEIYNRGTERAPRRDEAAVVAGMVILGEVRPAPPVAPPFAPGDAGPCRFTAEELYDDQWLFHGPPMQALVRVGPSAPRAIEGTLRVPPLRALLTAREVGPLVTEPIVLDSFTHLLGCWALDKLPEGDVVFPLRLASLRFFGDDPAEGSDVACRIAITALERSRVRADVDFVRPDGTLWMRLDGWEDWRFYWPRRYLDVFRAPERILLGERLERPGGTRAAAVWLEPPADMGRPVWRDVLEWTQLGPEERRALLARPGPENQRALRLWGRIAAKEAARRLWLEAGGTPIYPADLAIDSDPHGRPLLRSLAEPSRADMPAVSIAHTESVAVALAAGPGDRVGIDVERVTSRGPDFEPVAFTPGERALLDAAPGDRGEWVARLWCAKEAAAKATGFGLVDGPSCAVAVGVDGADGRVEIALAPGLAARVEGWPDGAVRVETARRGEYVLAWLILDPAGDAR